MEVAELPSGNFLPDTHTATRVKARVVELTRLTYDQFVRSVLLAQGQFADFLLRTDKNERAELLEQITGNTDYKRIEEVVKKRKNMSWRCWIPCATTSA